MTFQLAQINVARAKAPMADDLMKGFVEALDEINALADASPGFVWRLQSEGGHALEIRAYEDPLVFVNLSVWESAAALKNYVYKSAHTPFLARRQQWFGKFDGPHLALWWVPAGTRPDAAEGRRRLEWLAKHGPSREAFSFHTPFASPDGDEGMRLYLQGLAAMNDLPAMPKGNAEAGPQNAGSGEF